MGVSRSNVRESRPLKFVSYFPMFRYPPPRIDYRFKDGTTIQLGPIQITGHITAGHTRGAMTASDFGRWRKLQERTKAANPVDPFIDRAGYVTFVNRWEKIANAWLVHHGQSPLQGA